MSTPENELQTPQTAAAGGGSASVVHDTPVAHGSVAVPFQPDPRLAGVVQEFQYLLEKSQQLFAGLRDLPPTGRNWQPYFQRTFEVYTRLWKFQQQNRSVLEDKEYYGLKRWEIGEIASKIGQLYYHYYLRTSETGYLNESFVFYEAIRDRQYFRNVLDTRNATLMIKKLRYYARFIVVCLLLSKTTFIDVLIDELATLVADYTRTFNNADAAEWSVVLSEIATFLDSERKTLPLNSATKSHFEPIPSRLPASYGTVNAQSLLTSTSKLRLREAILVGNNKNQIKFSELTLDMYRILQSLERELGGPKQVTAADSIARLDGSKQDPDEPTEGERTEARRSNPHKYLLFRPTVSQLLLYLSTAFKDCCSADSSPSQVDTSAILLYLSADSSQLAQGSAGLLSEQQVTEVTADVVGDNSKQEAVAGVNDANDNAVTTLTVGNTTKGYSAGETSVKAGFTEGIAMAPMITARRPHQTQFSQQQQQTAISVGKDDAKVITSNKAQESDAPVTSVDATATTPSPSGAAGVTTTGVTGTAPAMSTSVQGSSKDVDANDAIRQQASDSTVDVLANGDRTVDKYASVDSLHPFDLLPFTRRPLFVIVESSNSFTFRCVPQIFGQSVAFLLSPEAIPEGSWTRGGGGMPTGRISGSLYSLFLHSPVKAFLMISEVGELDQESLSKLQSMFAELETTLIGNRSESNAVKRMLDPAFIQFLDDDFLRAFVARHLVCTLLLDAHVAFRGRAQCQPLALPALPSARELALAAPSAINLLRDATAGAHVAEQYVFPA